jgi:hypothetical protein
LPSKPIKIWVIWLPRSPYTVTPAVITVLVEHGLAGSAVIRRANHPTVLVVARSPASITVGRNNWFAIQADEGLSNEVAALVVFSHPAVITVPVEYGLAGEAPKYVVESPYRARHTSSTFSPSRSVGARPGLGRIRASRPADSDRQQDRPLDFCSKCNLQ